MFDSVLALDQLQVIFLYYLEPPRQTLCGVGRVAHSRHLYCWRSLKAQKKMPSHIDQSISRGPTASRARSRSVMVHPSRHNWLRFHSLRRPMEFRHLESGSGITRMDRKAIDAPLKCDTGEIITIKDGGEPATAAVLSRRPLTSYTLAPPRLLKR